MIRVLVLVFEWSCSIQVHVWEEAENTILCVSIIAEREFLASKHMMRHVPIT